eukprot:269898_1
MHVLCYDIDIEFIRHCIFKVPSLLFPSVPFHHCYFTVSESIHLFICLSARQLIIVSIRIRHSVEWDYRTKAEPRPNERTNEQYEVSMYVCMSLSCIAYCLFVILSHWPVRYFALFLVSSYLISSRFISCIIFILSSV